MFMPNLQIWEKLFLLSANGCPSAVQWLHKIPQDITCCLVDGEGKIDDFLTMKVRLPQTSEEATAIAERDPHFSTILQRKKLIPYDCQYLNEELQCRVYIGEEEIL